jgi:protein ImuB
LELLAERCRSFSPLVGLEPSCDDSLLLDITGLAHLFGGERPLAEAIVRDFAKLRLKVCVSIADTIGAAWAMSRREGRGERGEERGEDCKLQIANCELAIDARLGPHPSPLSSHPSPLSSLPSPLILPAGTPPAFFYPLPVELLRLPPETLRWLGELGIVSVGQLEALPREEFLARFGPVLLTRMDQFLGRLDEPVPAATAERKFAARWSAEYPTTRRETIEAALDYLSDRVAAALDRCGWGALRLECRLDLEGGERGESRGERGEAPIGRQWPIRNLQFAICNFLLSPLPSPLSPCHVFGVGMFRPTAAAGHWIELLRLSLDRLRIALPVAAICLTAVQTAPLEPRRQARLFDFDGRELARRRSRDLTALVERLSSRLGRQAVVRVRLRPEAQPELAWQEAPWIGSRWRNTGKAGGARLPPRPLRLLPRPRLLWVSAVSAATDTAPVEPPRQFYLAGKEYRVVRHWGPERIETGWWRGQPAGRDYFRVETAAGSRYWLFRRLRDGKWFLHGMFE